LNHCASYTCQAPITHFLSKPFSLPLFSRYSTRCFRPLSIVQIGSFKLANNVFVAPMAGVTDRPFRRLCKRLGAAYAVSEMAASNPQLWASEKTARRIDHAGEREPRAVQIAGSDPHMLAECARFNVERGAQIIDINMGCPAKKVCNVAAGSALLQDEDLVGRILDAVIEAVSVPLGVPVTLKMRTGWSPAQRNAVRIARRAEAAGICMLSLHGRTRSDMFHGAAEYDTIAAVKAAVNIPVVANGDIDGPHKARAVLDQTGADAIMIGRAAQGRPWLFREIAYYLATGEQLAAPLLGEVRSVLREHLLDHYAFYGEFRGVRTARKHIGWYVRNLPHGEAFRQRMNRIDQCDTQLDALDDYLAQLGENDTPLPESPGAWYSASPSETESERLAA